MQSGKKQATPVSEASGSQVLRQGKRQTVRLPPRRPRGTGIVCPMLTCYVL